MLSFVSLKCGKASPRIATILTIKHGGRSVNCHNYGCKQKLFNANTSGNNFDGSSLSCSYSTSVRMPSLSPTMSEGTIVKWYKAEGDAVQPGDILCDIQTDKAVVSFEFDDEGVLARVLRGDGSSGSVGDVIAVMADPGEDWHAVAAEAAKSPGSGAPAAKPAAPPAGAAAALPPAPQPQPPSAVLKESPASSLSLPPRRIGPAAQLLLRRHHLSAGDLRATGPHGTLLKSDVVEHVKSGGAAATPAVAAARPSAAPASPASATAEPSASRPSMRPLEPRTPPGYLDHPVAPGLRDWAALQAAIKSTVPHAYATAVCRPRLPAPATVDAASPIVALAVRALAGLLSANGEPVSIGVLQLAAPALPRLVRLARAQALGLAEIAKRLAAGPDAPGGNSGPLAAIVCDLSNQAAVQSAHLPLHPEAPLLLTVGRPSADPPPIGSSAAAAGPLVRLGLTVDSREFDHAQASALLGGLAAGMENPLLGLTSVGASTAAAASASASTAGIVGCDLLQLGLDD